MARNTGTRNRNNFHDEKKFVAWMITRLRLEERSKNVKKMIINGRDFPLRNASNGKEPEHKKVSLEKASSLSSATQTIKDVIERRFLE